MKIFCVGRNYVAHAQELGNEVPDEPVIFMKPKSALLQAHTPFYYPEFTNELHYECELVLRISKNGKYIQERGANKYYDAVTVGIDFTARDIQKELKEKRTALGKSKKLGQLRCNWQMDSFCQPEEQERHSFRPSEKQRGSAEKQFVPDGAQFRPCRVLHLQLFFR